MGTLLNAAKTFFQEEDWDYVESQGGLRLRFGGKHGQWRCFARVREPEGQFIFYSYAPCEILPEQFPAVAEYLMRANFGLFIGNFELNFTSGTVQFRTSIDVESREHVLSPTLLKHLVYQNVLAMDKYLPGLQAVLDNRAAPEEAVRQIEASD